MIVTRLQSSLLALGTRSLLLVFPVGAMALVASQAASSKQEEDHITIEYYQGFAGYQVPLRLVYPISKEEAEASDGSYYIAHRDAAGRILEVTSLFLGELFFRQEYTYDADGDLVEFRTIKGNGTVIRRKLNAAGKFVTVPDE